jgi:serine/threonine protein kinase
MNYQAKNYEVISELGSGAQGSVYLVKDQASGEFHAAKVVTTN